MVTFAIIVAAIALGAAAGLFAGSFLLGLTVPSTAWTAGSCIVLLSVLLLVVAYLYDRQQTRQ